MKKTKCEHCSREITNSNYKRHIVACDGTLFTGANNPNKSKSKRSLTEIKELRIKNANNARNSITDLGKKQNQFTKARRLGNTVPEAPLKGKSNLKLLGHKHTPETKEKMRISALASKHVRRSKTRIEYKTVNGDIVILDSSWEEALAIRLDETNVKWIRPEPIQWIDKEGVTHNYFSDFYLLEYDIFLDPKSEFTYNKQISKIHILEKTYDNVFFIRTLEECKQFNIGSVV